MRSVGSWIASLSSFKMTGRPEMVSAYPGIPPKDLSWGQVA